MERPDTAGFSLPELLITLTIVAILATITVPSYNGLVARSRRSDAMAELALVQLAQQRWRVRHASYAQDLETLGRSATVSTDAYYRLRIEQADAFDFQVLAQPQGTQRADPCGTFAMGANGPVYSAGYASRDCWNR
ncbi:MAG TPA: prepilin-type N-terminal cleavage/methylation domain-containing protein [Gammaproteobacteria bacterium]|nr:prepilin-type N-terminal cleavage/methylation domain-containing protein [Gammaproteobacteria bacterium]